MKPLRAQLRGDGLGIGFRVDGNCKLLAGHEVLPFNVSQLDGAASRPQTARPYERPYGACTRPAPSSAMGIVNIFRAFAISFFQSVMPRNDAEDCA